VVLMARPAHGLEIGIELRAEPLICAVVNLKLALGVAPLTPPPDRSQFLIPALPPPRAL